MSDREPRCVDKDFKPDPGQFYLGVCPFIRSAIRSALRADKPFGPVSVDCDQGNCSAIALSYVGDAKESDVQDICFLEVVF